jgi:predicted unusual protein kinase regulating ubiquinone biosynthesis (AarF/ABC1/UbiB family)
MTQGPISSKLNQTLRNVAASALHHGAAKALGTAEPSLNAAGLDASDFGVDDAFIHRRIDAVLNRVLGEPDTTKTPGAEQIAAAAASFFDASVTPAERRQKLGAASGDPLTDSVLAVLNDLAKLAPAGGFTKAGTVLAKALGQSNAKDEVADRWYAIYLPSPDMLAEVGAGLEALREQLKDPNCRAQLHRVLDVVRTLGRLEADQLQKISFDVTADPSKRAAAQVLLNTYMSKSLQAVVDTIVPTKSDVGALAVKLVELAALRIRANAGDATAADGNRFRTVLQSIAKPAASERSGLTELMMNTLLKDARSLPAKLDAARVALIEDLETLGVMNDPTREALHEISEDLSAVAVTTAHMIRFVGAAANDNIPERERIELIKGAATEAGPVVVKLLQTFANQAIDDTDEADAKKPKARTEPDSVMMKALLELHERVPPMSAEVVRTQLEAGLGKKIEKAFIQFDMEPLASASVGQIHRARIKTRLAGVRDVAVKIQRPNLDAEFARAARVARLGVQLAGEVIRIVQEEAGGIFDDLPEGIDPRKLIKLVEETCAGFVDGFAIETDFKLERENLHKFRRDMQMHEHMTAPHVFRRWSSKTVLTMEMMHLEKRPAFVERASVARVASYHNPPSGPLTGTDAEKAQQAVERAVDHIARTYGLNSEAGTETQTRTPTGTEIHLTTSHSLYSTVDVLVSDGGDITVAQAPPKIGEAEVRLVRDHFAASLLSQALIHGRVHGDPHKGNWGVMRDGETIAMLDFGKTIDLKKKHLIAPFRLAIAYFRKDENGMAEAVLTMTDAKNRDRDATKRALVKAFAPLVTPTALDASAEKLVAVITTVLAEQGLGLASVYTQSIKAGFSYAGNFAGFAQAGAGEPELSEYKLIGQTFLADTADTLSLGIVGSVLSHRKHARTRALNEL